jgi:hypothetical protein
MEVETLCSLFSSFLWGMAHGSCIAGRSVHRMSRVLLPINTQYLLSTMTSSLEEVYYRPVRRKAGTKSAGFFGGGENWKKIELAHPDSSGTMLHTA